MLGLRAVFYFYALSYIAIIYGVGSVFQLKT